jgi:sec-independent protein translocase protein TatA
MDMGGNILTPTHLIFLLLIALLLFGAKRLPEIGRSLGTGMREFKDSVTTSTPSVETHSELPPPVAVAPVAAAPVAAAPVAAAPVAAAPETAAPAPPATADAEREAEPVS